MDIGTRKEPGRELTVDEAHDVNGGYVMPDPEDPTKPSPDDPFGGEQFPPTDYSTP